jgi:predicted nucleotide-binding protein
MATGRWQSTNGARGTFEIEKMVQSSAVNSGAPSVNRDRDKVFIAYGHDEALREGVARYTHNLVGAAPVLLEEKANKGRSLLEKFEQETTDASYAISIATPDDVGYSIKDGPECAEPRARENVWFELGFFAGKLGRDRTCVLYRGNVHLPSDLAGIAYIPADNPETWKVRLARELHSAGFQINTEAALL